MSEHCERRIAAWVETNRVDYTYHIGTANHLGSAGDLIQVVHSTLVDGVPTGEPFWRQVTQYRYYKGDSAGSNNDDRLNGLTVWPHVSSLDHRTRPDRVLRPAIGQS